MSDRRLRGRSRASSLRLTPLILVVFGVGGAALGPTAVEARGLHLEIPNWYEPAYVDTQLTLTLGTSHFRGRTDGTLFFVSLAPVRRGPLEFGIELPYVFVRSPDAAATGLGDPRVDGRVRLPLPRTWPMHFYLDATARLPTASHDLFPYASGAQDFEVGGTLAVPRFLNMFLGAGRIFAEPPKDSGLTREDIPHSTHVWSALSTGRDAWWVYARGDLLLFDFEGEKRGVAKAGFGWRDPEAFLVLFDWSVDIGTDENRVFDHGPTLRFLIPITIGGESADDEASEAAAPSP